MRKICFAISFIGLFYLLGLLYWLPPIEVNDRNELSELEDNTKVIIRGFVEEEDYYSEGLILSINGVKVLCAKCEIELDNKEILIEGLVEEYFGEKQIKALKISILD